MSASSKDPRTSDAERLLAGFEPARVVGRRRVGGIVAAVVVLYLAVSAVYILATADNFQWDTVGSYLFDETILNGVWTTIYLTVLVCAIGILIGLVVALMMESSNRLVSGFANFYVWLIRGIPALVQLLMWYNLASLFPQVNIGIPPFGPVFLSVDPNDYITPLVAALLGLSICDSAYMAEIIRGGFLAVDKGQREAAAALGVSRRHTMFQVVLPQAMRSIIPAAGNQVVGNLKYTSLASVVGTAELLASAQLIYSVNFEIIPLLFVCSIWYLALTTVLSFGQRRIERHYGRGFGTERGSGGPSPRARRRRGLRPEGAAPAGPDATVPVSQEKVVN